MELKTRSKIGIIGAGAWPTTVALLLIENGHEVTQWVHRASLLSEMTEKGSHEKALPGIPIPQTLQVSLDIHAIAVSCDALIIGLPSAHLSALDAIGHTLKSKPVLSITKGLGPGFKRASLIIKEKLGAQSVSILSGPNLAKEIAAKKPAASVVASERDAEGLFWQTCLSSARFRVYRTSDTIGVELGGILKNVVAIGAGISDGLELGTNAKAALVTRGLKELMGFALQEGAQKESLEGLSGIGDLMATCHSDQSRNYRLGKLLGQGKNLDESVEEIQSAIEGMNTTQELYHRAQEKGIEMPITQSIFEVVYNKKNPRAVINALMERSLKKE